MVLGAQRPCAGSTRREDKVRKDNDGDGMPVTMLGPICAVAWP